MNAAAELEERVVLADPGGFMTVRHVRVRGTNFAIGRALAGLAIRRHGFAAERCREREDVVRARREYLARNYPVLLERARGVAAALGVDPADDRFDLAGIPYNVEAGTVAGCSDVYYPPSTTASGHGILSRNYDFPVCRLAELAGADLGARDRERTRPMMADPYVVEAHPVDGGRAALYLAAFDLLSGVLDGVNDAGLVVATNGDETALAAGLRPDPEGPGLHELQVPRFLLDSCATAADAAAAYRGLRRHVAFLPCQYLVGDAGGRAFTLDRTPGPDAGVTESCPNEPTVLTNHPPSVQLLHAVAGSVPGGEAGTSSFARYDRLAALLRETPRPWTAGAAERLNDEVTVARVVSWVPAERRRAYAAAPGLSRTLWHALYDTHELTLDVGFYLGDEPAAGGGFTERRSDRHRFRLRPRGRRPAPDAARRRN